MTDLPPTVRNLDRWPEQTLWWRGQNSDFTLCFSGHCLMHCSQIALFCYFNDSDILPSHSKTCPWSRKTGYCRIPMKLVIWSLITDGSWEMTHSRTSQSQVRSSHRPSCLSWCYAGIFICAGVSVCKGLMCISEENLFAGVTALNFATVINQRTVRTCGLTWRSTQRSQLNISPVCVWITATPHPSMWLRYAVILN